MCYRRFGFPHLLSSALRVGAAHTRALPGNQTPPAGFSLSAARARVPCSFVTAAGSRKCHVTSEFLLIDLPAECFFLRSAPYCYRISDNSTATDVIKLITSLVGPT